MINNINFIKKHYASFIYIGFFSFILTLIAYVIISTSSFNYPNDDFVIIKKGSTMQDVTKLLNKNKTRSSS